MFETDGAENHGNRLADWIIQKIGDGTPWSDSGRWNMRQPTHFSAWNNQKRPNSVKGDNFKLHDVKLWMAVHFWSCREVGLD